MRTVTGPTERVVVVGAGFAGLSAALHLAGAGRRVTVVDRQALPGGVAAPVLRDGYTFDTGPTVLTLPELFDRALGAVGERLADRVRLRRLDVAYRGFFADGSTLDIRAAPTDTAAEIERLAGPGEAAGFLRFAALAERLYRCEMRSFIDRNIDSPLDLLGPDLARVAALGGFRSLDRVVGRFLHDERVRRMFTFQALYAGVAPHRALGVYAVIPYMDTIAGVYAAEGGMGAVARALAAAAEAAGVEFRYGRTVTGVERTPRRVRAVLTAEGDRIPGDAFVFTADAPTVRRWLGIAERRGLPSRYAPSCFLVIAGGSRGYPGTAHHNIHFGRAWRSTFDALTQGRLMADPSFLVSRPTLTDPSLAPPGREIHYVLFPTPNLRPRRRTAVTDWSASAASYRDTVLRALDAHGYPGFADTVEVELVRSPADWAALGMTGGTPFTLAHTLAQTGPFRPGNLLPGVENAVLAGSATRPGVGVPTVMVSGRLAAQRITGTDTG